MSVATLLPAFTLGEVSPALFGRFDTARLHVAAATMRNIYAGYRGGAYSRAGTAFVGFSAQTGRAYPPRLVTFQFNVDQGLALEFGNQYMRVISDGAFVTETPVAITNATQANPCVITAAAAGALSATALNTGVVSPYAPGDDVTLAGGATINPTVLLVNTTTVLSVQNGANGTGYVPADTVNLAGGTQSATPVVQLTTTAVSAATVTAGGSGGTNGTQTVTGTTGTGTKFQASVTVAGGSITAVLGFTARGSYTVNPSNLSAEPVTGAGLTGATLSLSMGPGTLSVFAGGILSVNPVGLTFTQGSTSGGGTGATFPNALMGIHSVTVAATGVYATYPSNPVAQASTTGAGIGATFNVTTQTEPAWNSGDWIFVVDGGGMTQLSGNTYVLNRLTATTYALQTVYGGNVDSTAYSAYVSGGSAERIYTLDTPYAEADLPYLKWQYSQSADVLTLCCVNTDTRTEYEPQDLSRTSDTDWTFTPVVPVTSIAPPANMVGEATTAGAINYAYVVTAVADDGTESIASLVAYINGAVDIASTTGSILLNWTAVAGALYYNVYKAQPQESPSGAPQNVPAGALFGYAGQANGTQFYDNNIVADFTQVPPTHQNPFARGAILDAAELTPGTGYTQVGVSYRINTSTGAGAVLTPVIGSGGSGGSVPNSGTLAGFIVNDGGAAYADGDTVTMTGDGTGASGTLTIGPETGTCPSVAGYFQQRRAFANSLNNPDAYWMSQPGAFTNFDTRTPTIDSDAITGSPWSVQVNGIQWLVETSGGLLVMTGLSAWLLVGPGSFATSVQAIAPANQQVTPQAFSGCSPLIAPIKINYDILYVGAKGSYYYDLPYQLYALSEPIDITENSAHLFLGHTIVDHAWCEAPYKLLWAVRDDGILLSLTYYKTQQIAGWARHDTHGLFKSVCSVIELPVDALYCAVERVIGSNVAYTIERMDDRIWAAREDCWCVDCGLSLPQPTPAATLTASSATGLGACTAVTGLVGGAGWSSGTTAAVIDAPVTPGGPNGPGTGAVPSLTIAGGVITAITFSGGNQGSKYLNPQLVYSDPAGSAGGSGASAVIMLANTMTFTASAAVFSSGNVGSVIRMGGGIAAITVFTDTQHVTANMLSPIIDLIPNSAATPQPAASGSWTMTAPVTTVGGLEYLAGATVTGLADGNVITPQTVSATGTITLGTAASAITVGVGYQAQLQSVYIDAGEPTIQGQRKKISAITARIEATAAFQCGANQPDGSTQSPMQLAPEWNEGAGGLAPAPDTPAGGAQNFPKAPYNALCTPLRTGDVRVYSGGGWQTNGQVAVEQDLPLPLNVLAFIPELLPGDTPQTKATTARERKTAA